MTKESCFGAPVHSMSLYTNHQKHSMNQELLRSQLGPYIVLL
jgi:hypothetical protein